MNYTLMKARRREGRFAGGGGPGVLPLDEYLEMSRRLILRYAPPAYRTCMSSSEDALSHVAYSMMCRDARYDPGRGRTPMSWRIYAAKRGIADYVRVVVGAEGKTPPYHCVIPDRMRLDPVAADVRSEEDAERAAYVASLLRNLTPLQRECVVLRHVDGLKDAEIAEALGVPRRAVSGRIERGMRILRGLK